MTRIWVCAAAIVMGPWVAGAGPTFMGLGQLSEDGFNSQAQGVSDAGLVVVGGGGTPSGSEGFRWTAQTGMVGMGDLAGGSFSSNASSVSGDGSTVVGRSDSANGFEAYVWTQQTGMVGLGDLPGDGFDSQARGVSGDGSVVVGRGLSGEGAEAFRWDADTGMVGLGDLSGGAFSSTALAVSTDGLTIVGAGNSPRGPTQNGQEAFRWTVEDGMAGLGFLDSGSGTLSFARAVSSDGSVIVGDSQAGTSGEAFIWTEANGMVGLGHLGTPLTSVAFGLSADGSVVVGSSRPVSGNPTAFIWDAGNGMRSLQLVLTNELGLDLAGWELEQANGISGDTLTIVGSGRNPSGDPEAWIAVIPEPSVVALVAFGLVSLAGLRNKRQADF